MLSYLAQKAGLNPCGYDKNGQIEYIGSRRQWQRYDELEKQAIDELQDDEKRSKALEEYQTQQEETLKAFN